MAALSCPLDPAGSVPEIGADRIRSTTLETETGIWIEAAGNRESRLDQFNNFR